MTLGIAKVTPAIGAEISGIDLGGPLSNAQVSALHDALMAHQVIFFRDQQMSVEQHKALGRLG
jgi:taurine dioxygenase